MNVIAAIAATAALSTPLVLTWSTTTMKLLAPGITLTQEAQTSPALLVNVLTVDPSIAGMVVAPAVADDSLTNGTGDIRKGRENVKALAVREKLLAAVNGDYFPYTGDPVGLGVMNGEIYSEPYAAANAPGRAAIGWLPGGRAIVGIPALNATLRAVDGTTFAITGVDRMTATDNPNDLVLTTARFGPNSGARGNGTEVVLSDAAHLPVGPGTVTTAKVSAIVTDSPDPANLPVGGLIVSAPAGSPLGAQLAGKFHVGDTVTVAMHLSDITPQSIGAPTDSWDSVRDAIGGGPILVRNGQVIVDGAAEGFDSSFVNDPHARTAVGISRDGKITIVTVDDSSSLSAGISLPDLAGLLQSLGAVDAINLDGGGSTTMVVDGVTVDYPLGSTWERPVADMLTISGATDEQAQAAQTVSIATPLDGLQTGQAVPLVLRVDGLLMSGAQQSVIWSGPVGSVGFVTQDGVLHVFHDGHGTITATVNGVSATADVYVGMPAPPAAAATVTPTVAAPPAAPTNSNTPAQVGGQGP
jgi:hypothetical protein